MKMDNLFQKTLELLRECTEEVETVPTLSVEEQKAAKSLEGATQLYLIEYMFRVALPKIKKEREEEQR